MRIVALLLVALLGCGPDDPVTTLTRELEDHGVRVLDVREASFSLEDVFIAVVEQARARGQAVVRR